MKPQDSPAGITLPHDGYYDEPLPPAKERHILVYRNGSTTVACVIRAQDARPFLVLDKRERPAWVPTWEWSKKAGGWRCLDRSLEGLLASDETIALPWPSANTPDDDHTLACLSWTREVGPWQVIAALRLWAFNESEVEPFRLRLRDGAVVDVLLRTFEDVELLENGNNSPLVTRLAASGRSYTVRVGAVGSWERLMPLAGDLAGGAQ